ncbi:hypothetical protein HPB52_017717 [Rhipicephalus sanguineus]|uniref:Uncharacterized protein n=1 Tax=Rhipicephalus sanguineus TaxID=34632 RepID=A0A9D4YQH8_RHISA|nr:hypothetical protein HPB52_017717 [Rhipicephalus sanguineus]
MVAPSRVRPLTFFGKVPKRTTNVELVKALVERFSENDLKLVQEFGAGNFEVTFRSKGAVDRFLADSATLKVEEHDIRFECRGLRTVSVRIFKYPADASDEVLARELKVYGNVLSITVDNVPGFKSVSTGNRRARMEMREGVPNILDVEGHTIRCEYDGVVQPPSTDSAGVEDAQTTQGSDKEGKEQTENQSAPGAAEVQESEGRESEPVEASPAASQKPAPSAEAVLPASSAVEMRQEKEGGESESAEALPPTSEEATPRSPDWEVSRVAAIQRCGCAGSAKERVKKEEVDGAARVGCDCSELSDKLYSSTPDFPEAGEPVA